MTLVPSLSKAIIDSASNPASIRYLGRSPTQVKEIVGSGKLISTTKAMAKKADPSKSSPAAKATKTKTA